MMGSKRIGGREYLVKELRRIGLSKRGSVLILNIVLEEMKRSLSRGKDVEFPFGRLRVVKKHYSKYWDHVDDVPAGRQRYTVELELNEAGDRLLSGVEPKKKSESGK